MAPTTTKSFTFGYYYKAINMDVLDLLINRNIHIDKEKYFIKMILFFTYDIDKKYYL